MRGRLIAVVVVVLLGVLGFGGWKVYSAYDSIARGPIVLTTAGPVALASASAAVSVASEASALASPSAAISPAPADTSPAAASSPAATEAANETPAAGASADAVTSPSASTSPEASLTSTASANPSPSPSPTIPPEPTGLKAGWEKQYDRVEGGPEADLVVRTGDINNLGYGWPAKFTPFSGESTPVHPYPCQPRPGAAPGTDRIMLGTGVRPEDITKGGGDGYAGCSTRPGNLPAAIPIEMGALPGKIRVVLVQMFLDDFQSPVWHSHFQVSMNGTRIKTFEDTIATMDQTGPIGKLVTLRLFPEYWPILKQGRVDLSIDDPTSHALDGYAVDFVRVLVNPHAFTFNVTIKATVVDADTHAPIEGATVSAAQVDATTAGDGTAKLFGVPAGLVSVSANALGYDGAVQLIDLPAGSPGAVTLELKKHAEGVADLQRSIQQNGSVAIYGIHFDTASSNLRPDSTKSLETVLELVKSIPGSKWIISGHTDNQGGADYNLELSDARAHSVVGWLVRHGIGNDRFIAKGYGLTRPVADNATENGRALNRRVEVAIQR